MYSDITIDYVKMTLLNLPAVLLVGHFAFAFLALFPLFAKSMMP